MSRFSSTSNAAILRAVQTAQGTILAQMQKNQTALLSAIGNISVSAANLQPVLAAIAGQGIVLTDIQTKEGTLMSDANALQGTLDTLTASVATTTTVEESAATLLAGIKTMLDAAVAAAAAAGATPAQLAAVTALTAQLDTGSTALTTAITANTPAAVTPPPPPPPPPA